MEVSSLWIGGDLPKISLLCIQSFLKNGYKFNLYTYDTINNIPKGVTIKNGEDILPKSEIFTYKNGSVSAFSNLFRFTMIYKTGQVWVDTDIFCRQKYDFSQSQILIVSEPDQNYEIQKPTSNLIQFPKEDPIMKRAIEICESYKEQIETGDFKWGLGPLTIKKIVEEFQLEKYIKSWKFSNNCNNHHYQILYSNKIIKKYNKFPIFDLNTAPKENFFIHLWNEHFRYKKTPVHEMFQGDNTLTHMWNSVFDHKILDKKEKILITGGSGLVGTALKKVMSDFTIFTPRSSELNLLDFTQLDDYLKKNKITCIIHLAANVGGLFKNMNQKVNMLEDNLLINFNVLKAAHNNKIKKLISCLSTCIFPDKTSYPISEKMLHDGPPHTSNDAYAYAKRMIDIHSRAYREQYNDNFVSIIPTNIYGPNDNYDLEDAHVIPALIHKCFLAKKNKKKFIVKGSGKPLRQFIYSEDLAQLIKWVYLYYNDSEPIILAQEDEYSIGDVARLIAKEYDYESNMHFDTKSADGQFKKTADNTKLKNFLKLHSIKMEWTPIDEGIKKSVQWFVENGGRGFNNGKPQKK